MSYAELFTLIGVSITFLFVIFLIRRKYNFGLSLLIGSLILGVFSLIEISLSELINAILKASLYSFETHEFVTETIELALLMTLIYMLAKLMQETGAITKLIDSLRSFFSKGGILALIPAVYGLMPVPGGALFSAPMIDEEGDIYHINKDQKNMLNIWFRHIWFPIYPVSAAMILICSADFSHISIYSLILANMISFVASVGIGLFFLNRFIKKDDKKMEKIKKDSNGFIYLLPLITPLLFYVFLQFFGFSQTRCFLIGVVFSIIILFLISRIQGKTYLHLIRKSLTSKLALAIFGIMIFREVFEVSNANVIIANLITGLAFPAMLFVIVIPLILGLLTGYNLGAIALSYFLVQPFFPFSGVNIIGLTSIIFMSSFVGYLISPIHLCNVLSSDYLKTDTTRMYRMFLPAACCLLLVQVVFVIIFFRI
jgi:integral membrane protein (TIGR00529 family)